MSARIPPTPEAALAQWRNSARRCPSLVKVNQTPAGERFFFRASRLPGGRIRKPYIALPALTAPDFDTSYFATWRAVLAGETPMADAATQSETPAPQAKAPSPGASHKIAELYMALDDAYDRAAHNYKPGWSDAKIAAQVGVAETLVQQRREQDFGTIPKSKEEALRDEIGAAIVAIDKWVTDATRKHAAFGDHLQLLNTDHKQLGQDIARLREHAARLVNATRADAVKKA